MHAPMTGGNSFSELVLPLVVVRGAGDLATGVALRLHRCGFPVVMTEIERPLVVRRAAAFAQAIYDGETTVEEVRAVHCQLHTVQQQLSTGAIPVLIDPHAADALSLQPDVLVDAIMAKTNTGTNMAQAPLVIGLGPGFEATVDCHAVIETNRGHRLGTVLWKGSAQPNTGTPGILPGVAAGLKRALYAPASGHLQAMAEIGDHVRQNDVLANVVSSDGESYRVRALFDGVLRGLIHPSVEVAAGMKIGDVDPRIDPSYCFTVSDKSLAIGGGVLEAILSAMHRSLFMPTTRHPKDQ